MECKLCASNPLAAETFLDGQVSSHTLTMLGPNGDSNGCVVFKTTRPFLQAFQNGEVKRLVVVAHLD